MCSSDLVATEIMRLVLEKGGFLDLPRRVWFVAHLREILDDTAKRLRKAGIPFGEIRPKCPQQYDLPVQVASVWTAAARQGLPPADLIIVDECHLAVAPTYLQVVATAGHPRLLGLTGTPERLDGQPLRLLFDHLIPTCSTAELIEEGLLVPIRLFCPTGTELGDIRTKGADFDQDQASAILSRSDVVGDALAHWQRWCQCRRGVAFCSSVRHAHEVAEQWRAAGYRAMAVHGDADDDDRREAIAGLRAGRLDLVACERLWIAGVDVPEIDAVVWLRATQSLVSWLQGNGRGLRCAPWAGKRDLIILDPVRVAGRCNAQRLGHPLQVHEWSLEGRRSRPRETLSAGRECPQCWAFLPGRPDRCAECGYEFPRLWSRGRELEHVDGELEEVDPATAKLRQLQREQAEREARRERERQIIRSHPDSLAGLQAAARELGRKPGWAWHRWQAREARRSGVA